MPRRKERPRVIPTPIPAVDPDDPVQQLDETNDFHVEPLEIAAVPTAEQEDELDAAIELAEEEAPEKEDVDPDEQTDEERTAHDRDVGELYGVHLPPAADPEHGSGPDGGEYAEAELGENWLETLETDAAEGGPVAERAVDPNDDSDELGGHHATESGDRPVADKGSGGPAGL